MSRWLTPDALRAVLVAEVRRMGEQQIAAKQWGISPQYLSDVLKSRREPGAKLLKALGYQRIVIYQKGRA